MHAHCILPCRKFQHTTHQLIPKLPFSRLVREITAKLIDESPRWQRRAVEALQEAAEAYLVRLLLMFASVRACALILAIHGTRKLAACLVFAIECLSYLLSLRVAAGLPGCDNLAQQETHRLPSAAQLSDPQLLHSCKHAMDACRLGSWRIPRCAPFTPSA